jgi:hypothetical protein
MPGGNARMRGGTVVRRGPAPWPPQRRDPRARDLAGHADGEHGGGALRALDQAILGVFVVEIALRLFAHRRRFFRDPWSVFDFIVVAIALVPASGRWRCCARCACCGCCAC